jgi:hypothetical protein
MEEPGVRLQKTFSDICRQYNNSFMSRLLSPAIRSTHTPPEDVIDFLVSCSSSIATGALRQSVHEATCIIHPKTGLYVTGESRINEHMKTAFTNCDRAGYNYIATLVLSDELDHGNVVFMRRTRLQQKWTCYLYEPNSVTESSQSNMFSHVQKCWRNIYTENLDKCNKSMVFVQGGLVGNEMFNLHSAIMNLKTCPTQNGICVLLGWFVVLKYLFAAPDPVKEVDDLTRRLFDPNDSRKTEYIEFLDSMLRFITKHNVDSTIRARNLASFVLDRAQKPKYSKYLKWITQNETIIKFDWKPCYPTDPVSEQKEVAPITVNLFEAVTSRNFLELEHDPVKYHPNHDGTGVVLKAVTMPVVLELVKQGDVYSHAADYIKKSVLYTNYNKPLNSTLVHAFASVGPDNRIDGMWAAALVSHDPDADGKEGTFFVCTRDATLAQTYDLLMNCTRSGHNYKHVRHSPEEHRSDNAWWLETIFGSVADNKWAKLSVADNKWAKFKQLSLELRRSLTKDLSVEYEEIELSVELQKIELSVELQKIELDRVKEALIGVQLDKPGTQELALDVDFQTHRLGDKVFLGVQQLQNVRDPDPYNRAKDLLLRLIVKLPQLGHVWKERLEAAKPVHSLQDLNKARRTSENLKRLNPHAPVVYDMERGDTFWDIIASTNSIYYFLKPEFIAAVGSTARSASKKRRANSTKGRPYSDPPRHKSGSKVPRDQSGRKSVR